MEFQPADGDVTVVRLDEAIWSAARSLDAFIASAQKYPDLWRTTRFSAAVDEDARAAVAHIASPLRLLVLLEDWCTDATHTIPYIARLIEPNSVLELRVLSRDAHQALMDAHLTNGSRSIPVLMVFDAAGNERGWWGPRPAPLQTWAMNEGAQMEPVERYRRIRTWLVHDGGQTVVREILPLLQRAAAIGV